MERHGSAVFHKPLHSRQPLSWHISDPWKREGTVKVTSVLRHFEQYALEYVVTQIVFA